MNGACHCGVVTFKVENPPLEAIRCNCSYCVRRGWFTGYATVEEFKITSGEDSLSSYEFGERTGTNYFCSRCGIHTHLYGSYKGDSGYAYSIACLENLDIDSLPIKKVDGRSF